jgi:hypothetical protein
MPKPSPPPQPKRPPSRIWLFGPYVAVGVAAIAWSGVWLAERAQVLKALDDAKASLAAQGAAAGWTQASLDGWPFRLHLTLTAPHLADPSGWALDAPTLDAVALAYQPGHWGLDTPQGLTLTRPGKGPLQITGRAIRASAAALGSDRPRFAFEGDDLVFTPGAGAQPGPLGSVAKLELDLQPGPSDQAALFVGLDGAKLRRDLPLAVLDGDKPMSLKWDARVTHVSALKGPTWPARLQAWTTAGGAMTVAQGQFAFSGVSLAGAGGPLTVGPDGRLSGALPLKLDPGPNANKALVKGLDLLGPVTLSFKDGRAAIGGLPLGPAFKVG